jgi:hypothetical protein
MTSMSLYFILAPSRTIIPPLHSVKSLLLNASHFIRVVSDEGASKCVDPEGNGVNPGEGVGGGLAHLVRGKISS